MRRPSLRTATAFKSIRTSWIERFLYNFVRTVNTRRIVIPKLSKFTKIMGLIQRRDNLSASIEDLGVKLNAAREDLADAFEDLKKVDLINERSGDRNRDNQITVEEGEAGQMAEMALMRVGLDNQ